MTKKQHYVPRFYLERFADGQSFVHVYDFKQHKYYKTKPENICYQNSFRVMKMNSRIFLRRIDRVCHIDQNPKALIYPTKEKETLIRLAINFFIRTPQVMEALSVNDILKEIEDLEWMEPLRGGISGLNLIQTIETGTPCWK